MITRGLFLGAGAAPRDRLAGNRRLALVCVFQPSLHNGSVMEGKAGLAEGCGAKTWPTHSPVNPSSSSAESQRCQWPLPALSLLWARQAGSTCPGKGQGQGADLERRCLPGTGEEHWIESPKILV